MILRNKLHAIELLHISFSGSAIPPNKKNNKRMMQTKLLHKLKNMRRLSKLIDTYLN